jgi:PAS domain S-box-containing protein
MNDEEKTREQLISELIALRHRVEALETLEAQHQRAEEALRDSKHRFHDVALTSGDWIWEMDAAGRYTYASPTVQHVLGYTPEEVVGRPYSDFLLPQNREKFEVLIREYARRGEPFTQLISSNAHRNGGTVILESTGLPLTDAAGNLMGYRGVHRDITARQRLEERLKAVHILGQELVLSRDVEQIAEAVTDAASLLLHSSLCSLWLVDEQQQRIQTARTRTSVSRESIEALSRRPSSVNRQAEDTVQLRIDEGQGIVPTVVRTGASIYLPDVREDPRYVDPGVASRSELCMPLQVKGKIIGALNVESERLDAFGEEEQRILSTLVDQAALAIENARLYEQMRTARDRLQTLSRRLIEVQETERRHIARELHDEVSQVLTGLKLLLETSYSLPVDSLHSRVNQALGLVDELATRVQELSLNLRPAMLDDLGLLPTLVWHFNRYTEQTNVHVDFKYIGPERRLAPQIETAAYRVVQEALTNVARHADVSEVTVQLRLDQDALGVHVEDRGRGFNAESALTAPTTRGLSGMQERAVLLGGQLAIQSAPGAGTCLIAEFPLSDPAEEA